MGLKLLHLSDIHFGQNGRLEEWDLDKKLRTEFGHDLKKLVDEVGQIDAILIVGDIAFSGEPHEYQWASDWITEVCQIAGCREENVLTVPGNHDVNRGAIDQMILDTQTKLRNLSPRSALDSNLKEHWKKGRPNHLLAPLNNYNDFALRYGTVVEGNTIHWEKDFEFEDSAIRIRGLNSALVSNSEDHQDRAKLVLGSLQTMIIRNPGVIHLVICHHPPSWLKDGLEVERDLRTNSRIQLFGHRHDFERVKSDNSIQLFAGAFHPERTEKDWEPRYNLLELTFDNSTGHKILNVDVWQRVWKKARNIFAADFDESGSQKHSISLDLDEVEAQPFVRRGLGTITDSSCEPIEIINVDTQDSVRKLRYLFFKLSYLHRSDIAHSMTLIQESDFQLSDLQKAAAYFQRAQTENRLAEMWDRVVEHGQTHNDANNPFKK